LAVRTGTHTRISAIQLKMSILTNTANSTRRRYQYQGILVPVPVLVIRTGVKYRYSVLSLSTSNLLILCEQGYRFRYRVSQLVFGWRTRFRYRNHFNNYRHNEIRHRNLFNQCTQWYRFMKADAVRYRYWYRYRHHYYYRCKTSYIHRLLNHSVIILEMSSNDVPPPYDYVDSDTEPEQNPASTPREKVDAMLRDKEEDGMDSTEQSASSLPIPPPPPPHYTTLACADKGGSSLTSPDAAGSSSTPAAGPASPLAAVAYHIVLPSSLAKKDTAIFKFEHKTQLNYHVSPVSHNSAVSLIETLSHKEVLERVDLDAATGAGPTDFEHTVYCIKIL
jgi:hypothetical protein